MLRDANNKDLECSLTTGRSIPFKFLTDLSEFTPTIILLPKSALLANTSI